MSKFPYGLWNCRGRVPTRSMKTECAQFASGQLRRASPLSHLEISFWKMFGIIESVSCRGAGLEPLFPVWQIPTRQLSLEMIAAGVKAKITCVDPSKVAKSFAGRDYNLNLLNDLPLGADPWGENGEFHTFVYDAPVFSRPIDVQAGEVVERDGFVFADLLLSLNKTRNANSRVRTRLGSGLVTTSDLFIFIRFG